jgi:YhcH/YjgK/YiaL family protein
MIASDLPSISDQIPMSAGLHKAIQFLSEGTWERLSEGRFEIDGDLLWGLVQAYNTNPAVPHEFETHPNHVDLHYIVSGEETIYWTHAQYLSAEGVYDQERDVWLSALEVSQDVVTPLRLRAGDVAVFFPCDGHMPRHIVSTPGEVKKILVKVATIA